MTLETPITVGDITLERWIEGHTYEDSLGRTYYSGAASPSVEDAEDCIATPRTFSRVLSATEAEALLDAILDGWAKAWGYTSAARCITYCGDPDETFDAEGVAMRAARSALWVAVRAASENPETPPLTEANVRAFAAPFEPARP